MKIFEQEIWLYAEMWTAQQYGDVMQNGWGEGASQASAPPMIFFKISKIDKTSKSPHINTKKLQVLIEFILSSSIS
jgi:hypothetical protein